VSPKGGVEIMTDQGIVYVVDDDPSLRDFIEHSLQRNGFFVKSYASAEALAADAQVPPAGQQPHCLLLDIRMPGESGVQLLARLREGAARAGRVPSPVIIISARASVREAVESMKLGAVDVLEKPFATDALVALVRETIDRHREALAVVAERESVRQRLARLSPRERELLDSIVQGRSTKMIADSLGISARTVDHHRANLMEKMKAENVADLVRMAMQADYRTVS
jgi:two-component system response regulator FixJ